MTSVGKLRFYVVKRKRAFWQPSAALRRAGYQGKALGPDGPRAEAKAAALTAKALERIALDTPQAGTLAHYFCLFMKTRAMARKKPRTQEEYRTAWLRIGEHFGDQLITEISVDDIDEFYDYLTDYHSEKVRHRAIAKLREILSDAVSRRVIPTNPAEGIRNVAPKARTQFWFPSERQALIDGAKRGMALVLWIMNETARAPVDARNVPLEAIQKDIESWYIDRSREKTGADGMQAISDELASALFAYATDLGVTPLPGVPLIRRDVVYKGRKTPEPWRNGEDWSKDFRQLRISVFGEEEKRQARDIRRSVNLEAALGDATPEDRAALLANQMHRDKRLDETYTPPTLAAARKAMKARITGREIMEQMKEYRDATNK